MDEIVSQVLHARHNLTSRGLSGLRNLVLMGMGEPLHNYDTVMQALSIITDSRGLNLGAAKISISTVGLVPGIRRLADENQPYNLALSLHASTDEQRSKLIPVNRRWPLAELMAACRYYGEKTNRRIFVEWTLIRGGKRQRGRGHVGLPSSSAAWTCTSISSHSTSPKATRDNPRTSSTPTPSRPSCKPKATPAPSANAEASTLTRAAGSWLAGWVELLLHALPDERPDVGVHLLQVRQVGVHHVPSFILGGVDVFL